MKKIVMKTRMRRKTTLKRRMTRIQKLKRSTKRLQLKITIKHQTENERKNHQSHRKKRNPKHRNQIKQKRNQKHLIRKRKPSLRLKPKPLQQLKRIRKTNNYKMEHLQTDPQLQLLKHLKIRMQRLHKLISHRRHQRNN